MSYPRNFKHSKKASDLSPAAIIWLVILGVPLLALFVFAISALVAAVGSIFVLAAVNWGLVTAGHIFGFSVATIGLVEAFKLSFAMQAAAGIIGGMRAASSKT